MSIRLIKNLLNIRELKKPVFTKEFKESNKQLEDLIKLKDKVKEEKTKYILKDINNIKQGLEGERRVAYELENSFIPMLVLHDLRIEVDGHIAQIDFLLITDYFICVLETKLLNGDISINNLGEFTRKTKYKIEGVYSPIVQNERHIKILKQLFKKHSIAKMVEIDSLVIMANPKSIIRRQYAPKDIKNKIIRYDQIVNMIETKNKLYKSKGSMSEDKMYNISNFLINQHKEATYDYIKKYSLSAEDFKPLAELNNLKTNNINKEKNISEDLEKEIDVNLLDNNIDKLIFNYLKNFRLTKSKIENKKAYMIFSNNTLEQLVERKPSNKEELLAIDGFGKVKVDNYGDEILAIINKYKK